MRDKIIIAVILLMCSLLLIPPMFAKGGLFDVVYLYQNSDGSIDQLHGLYHDNVFNSIFTLLLSYLGLIIPYLKPTLKWYWKWISSACGSWFVAGLFYELMNFTMPKVVLNTMDENWTYIKFLIIFTLGIAFIITHETWNREKKY